MSDSGTPNITAVQRFVLREPRRTRTSVETPRPSVVGEALEAADALDPEDRPSSPGGAASEHDGLPVEGDVVGGHYRLVRRLGEGMFGRVYVAERTDVPEHLVALKVMTRAVYAGRNVERELVMLAAASHPHIVQLKDHGVAEDYVWLTMPLYEGETLAQRLERGPLSLREAYDIFLPITRGVQALHERGLRHQDIKPENVYLARLSGRVHPVVLDLGVAVEQNASFVAGTVLYCSPEQVMALSGFAAAAELSAKMDTYCLATTLLRALVGHDGSERDPTTPLALANLFERRELVPLTDDDLTELTGEPRRLLEEALRRWLRRVPEERASTCTMAEELDVLLAEERAAADAIERQIRHQKVALGRVRIALAAMAVLGVGAGLFTYSKRETLRLASELARVRAEGAASFEELDTCVASHELTRREAESCDAERRKDDESNARELATIAGQSGAARQALERRIEGARQELKTCEEDAAASAKTCAADTTALEGTLTSRAEAWGRESLRLTSERDEQKRHRTSCESTLTSTGAAREECRSDLAACIEDRETCMNPPEPKSPPPPPAPAAATPGGTNADAPTAAAP